MTADFIQTAISKSAKRIFTAEFTNAAAYDAIIAEITGVENPLGLAEVELGKQTYKTYVGYFDPNTSEMNGKVQVTAYSRAEYSAAITALTGSADLKIRERRYCRDDRDRYRSNLERPHFREAWDRHLPDQSQPRFDDRFRLCR